ncbi:hypothetical protein EMGBD4_16440 [Verrucomicrobiota bacterium]|nr:hypothetical protein EMGBD4_16440 [Verrucomicrobiota bacterium]
MLGEFGGAAASRKGGNTPPLLLLADADVKAKLAAAESVVGAAQDAVQKAAITDPTAQAAWEAKLRTAFAGKVATWSLLTPQSATSLGGATLTRQPDGSLLAGGKNPTNDTYVVKTPVSPGLLTGLLLEVLPDPSLPGGSLGRYTNGNFVLSGVDVALLTADGKRIDLAIVDAQSDFDQPGYPIKSLVDEVKPVAKGKKAAPKTKTGPAGPSPATSTKTRCHARAC